MTVTTLTIRRPDDWHVHLRDGEMLKGVLPYTARQFARAIVMPNLSPPMTDVAGVSAYRDRILAVLPEGLDFTPLMTCYLTDGTDPDEIRRGHASGIFTAAKLYPAHATTNSAHGVTAIDNICAVLEVMQAIGMPLLIHGEVTDHDVDIFDREAVFIERTLDTDRTRISGPAPSSSNISPPPKRLISCSPRPACRRDDHAAAPAHQPQRHAGRRHSSPRLLPARCQAREAPAGAAQGSGFGQSQILPWH
jgi:hypothetical protein